jgi:hypothetical protein
MSFRRVGANGVRHARLEVVDRRRQRQHGGHLEELTASELHRRIIDQ